MSKMIKELNLSYSFDATRKGAKYTIDNGAHWMNAGEFLEVAAKAAHGLKAEKDSNTRFDQGSDVPEHNASVKSAHASLTNMKLGENFEESVKTYFEKVASTEFWYTMICNDNVIIFKMDANLFEQFVRKFAKLNERGVLRLPGTNSMVLSWLNIHVKG